MPRGRPPMRIKREDFRRKCHHCGKMVLNPLTISEVPPIDINNIPFYKKNDPTKKKRVDRKDVKTSYYCASDEECLTKARPDFL